MITNDDSQKLLEEDCFGLLELLTTDTIKIINDIFNWQQAVKEVGDILL